MSSPQGAHDLGVARPRRQHVVHLLASLVVSAHSASRLQMEPVARDQGLDLIEGPRLGQHPEIGVTTMRGTQIGDAQSKPASHAAGLSDPALLFPPVRGVGAHQFIASCASWASWMPRASVIPAMCGSSHAAASSPLSSFYSVIAYCARERPGRRGPVSSKPCARLGVGHRFSPSCSVVPVGARRSGCRRSPRVRSHPPVGARGQTRADRHDVGVSSGTQGVVGAGV